MAIDFSLLQAMPGARAVGQLPQQPSAVGQFAGGLMSGISQGTNIAAQQQQMAASRQQMDQSAQVFPLQKQELEQKVESGKMDLQDKVVAQKMLDERRNAAKQGLDAYKKTLYQQDPAAGIKFEQDQADLKSKLADAAGKMSDSLKKQQDNAYSLAEGAGNLASSSVKLATQPGPDGKPVTDWNKANQVYQQQLAGLKKSAPELASVYPQQLDHPTAVNLISVGTDAHNAQLQKLIDKKSPPVNPYNTMLAGADGKILDTETDKVRTTSMLIRDTEDAKAIMEKIPNGYTGPIVDYLKANKLDSQVQMLQKLQADIPLLYRNMVGMNKGVGRFTNGILEQLKTATGTTALNRDALTYIVDRVHDVAIDEGKESYKTIDNIRSQGDPDKYQHWKSGNPEPAFKKFSDSSYKPGQPAQSYNVPDGRVAVINPKGQTVHIPKEQLDAAMKQGYKQVGK